MCDWFFQLSGFVKFIKNLKHTNQCWFKIMPRFNNVTLYKHPEVILQFSVIYLIELWDRVERLPIEVPSWIPISLLSPVCSLFPDDLKDDLRDLETLRGRTSCVVSPPDNDLELLRCDLICDDLEFVLEIRRFFRGGASSSGGDLSSL